MQPDVLAYFNRRYEIPGWFDVEDFRLFDLLLAGQPHGDLLEIGAYEGASAVLLGLHRREGETFTVCDLFALPEDPDNLRESERYYTQLTRTTFERNYVRFVSELPSIVQDDSRRILDHLTPDTCRFVHIDGCHVYDFARADIGSARRLLRDGGVVVCDDWRNIHTPGVTAAVIEELTSGGLHTIAITPQKFYGSWSGDRAAELRHLITEWAAETHLLDVELEPIMGVEWVRVLPVTRRRPPLPQRAVAKLRRKLALAAERRAARA